LVRFALVAFFIGFLLHSFFNIYAGVIFTVITLVLLSIFSKRIQTLYQSLENRFFSNLNAREIEQSKSNRAELAPWDAHIVPLTVPVNSPCVGKTLLELKWREQIGVNVVMIKRGEFHISAPGKHQMIFPHDELLVLGTDNQIMRLKALIRPEVDTPVEEDGDMILYNYVIPENSALIGKTIRETGIREQANALVVGIERNDERILNPESDMKLQVNDTLFIVADKKIIRDWLAQHELKEA